MCVGPVRCGCGAVFTEDGEVFLRTVIVHPEHGVAGVDTDRIRVETES